MKCELTEMDKLSCAHCRTVTGPPWQAKYSGICAICKRTIDVGDNVRWTEAGDAVQHAAHR